MIAENRTQTEGPDATADHLGLIRLISYRLKRRFPWIDSEDLFSYSALGVAQAASLWQGGQGGTFGAYASVKGMFLAIDQMRKDRLIRRSGSPRWREIPMAYGGQEDDHHVPESADARGSEGLEMLEKRDLLERLMRDLPQRDRHLLELRFADELTFAEIGKVLGVSESAACLRNSTLLKTLKRKAVSTLRTGESGMEYPA